MQAEFEAILTSDLPEIEKLAKAFFFILSQSEANTRTEIELLKALGDEQALLKEQIKQSTLKHSGEIFGFCYYRVTGRRLRDV